MIEIDGSFGEGGGQIIRSSLALSLVTGQGLRITNIRAKRKVPGLRRQHVTCVRAAAEIGEAEFDGAEVGSSEIRFSPTKIRVGEFHFQIGSAGSTTLVLQTILPALLMANERSTVTIEGGTHNPMCPPFDFLTKAYLPLVNRMGPSVEACLDKYGFYPAGGGQVQFSIDPGEGLWKPLKLESRGRIKKRLGFILLANLPDHIADREHQLVTRELSWRGSDVRVDLVSSAGPGNVVLLEVHAEKVTEVFTGFGEKGKRAETVARTAIKAAKQFLNSNAAVGEYLADQLLLPMGICAHFHQQSSEFTVQSLSSHATTHIELLQRFLNIDIHIEEVEKHVLCRVCPAA